MNYLKKLSQLQFVLSVAYALVGIVVFGLFLMQTSSVVENKGVEQAYRNVHQLGAMAADLIQQRTQIEMRAAGSQSIPTQSMIARQGNAAVQNFPGQIVLIDAGNGQSIYTTFDSNDSGMITEKIMDNAGKESFEIILGQSKYIATKQKLLFGTNYSLEGYFFINSTLAMAPYEHIISRIQVLVFLGILLLAGVGFFIGHFLSISLRNITKTIHEAEQGDKPEKLNEMSIAVELRELIKALNLLIQGPSAKDIVRKEANTDVLTGLLNRRGFIQAMDEKFSQGGQAAEMSAMFMDLDGFKPINDTHGHDVGDDILREVAKRLIHCTREEDIVCRLGGDEFVLLFPGLRDKKVLEDRADKVLAKINEPYWVNDTRVTMGASIGISVGPDDGKSGEELLNAADEAMYSAKKTGKNQFTFYS